MIEDLFPKTVGNILDYDAIKLAAKQYVEDIFVNIVQEFADNMTLYTMDAAHLADVAGHVAGDSSLSLEQLLDYINAENIYHECDFVSELLAAFPEGVEYKEFDVTGCGFPSSDFFPFNNVNRSFHPDGTPTDGQDTVWIDNASSNLPERNLLMSRYKGQFDGNDNPHWHRKEGRRSSWGNPVTWMTTGGFGKPGTIHINVDEEHSVIEENGLTSVENWLGTVSHKLPINLYIEINSNFTTNAEPASSSLTGYHMAFPYEEEEGFCTNDPDWPDEVYHEPEPGPEPPQPDETPNGYIVVDSTGAIQHSIDLDEMFIHQIQHSVEVVNFYFTPNGAAETENSELESGVDVTLYNADGTVADDALYDGAGTLTYTQANGNMFEAADGGDLISLQSGALVMNPNADYTALSVQVEYISPLKEAYFTNQGASRTSNYTIGGGSYGFILYSPEGNNIDVSQYKTAENYAPIPWTIIGIYDYAGNYVSVTNRYFLACAKSNGYLNLRPDGSVWDYYDAYKVVYKES